MASANETQVRAELPDETLIATVQRPVGEYLNSLAGFMEFPNRGRMFCEIIAQYIEREMYRFDEEGQKWSQEIMDILRPRLETKLKAAQ